jgi:hypothetical protein
VGLTIERRQEKVKKVYFLQEFVPLVCRKCKIFNLLFTTDYTDKAQKDQPKSVAFLKIRVLFSQDWKSPVHW